MPVLNLKPAKEVIDTLRLYKDIIDFILFACKMNASFSVVVI